MPGTSVTEPTPHQYLVDVAGNLLLARALGIAAELRIADRVAQRPHTIAELAEATGAHEESLYRVLRMLGGHGVFAEDEQGRVVSTPRADVLRTDHPESMHDMLSLGWQNIHWATFQHLPDAVMNGDVAFERAFGQGFFDYLAAHPEANSVFDQRMAVVSRAENAPLAAAYPFGKYERIADIGGGQGGLLAAILKAYPDVTAVLFEQPQVLEEPADLVNESVLDRVELIAGNFFESVPAGADLYVMKRIIHDWDDARALRILRNCRAAMRPGNRIAVIDAVMLPGNDPDPKKSLDLGIMALTPGKERTEAEFGRLFEAAGLRLTRIVHPEPPALVSIVEGEIAENNG